MLPTPTSRFMRLATLAVVLVALFLVVFAAGPAHFGAHLDDAHTDCAVCHITFSVVDVDLPISQPLALVHDAPPLIDDAPHPAEVWAPSAPRAPPLS